MPRIRFKRRCTRCATDLPPSIRRTLTVVAPYERNSLSLQDGARYGRRMAFIDVGGTRFGYDEAGEGPAIVFIHGALVDRGMWDHQFGELSERYRVIRYDWRGYGESDDATEPVCHHEDLLALMDALGVEHAHLAGNSYGGAYAVEAALAAPERVASLSLWAAGMSGHVFPPEMGASVREAIADKITPETLKRYAAGLADVDADDVEVMAAAQLDYTFVGPKRRRDDVDSSALARAESMCRRMFERTWSGPAKPQRFLEPPAKTRLGEVTVPTLVVNGVSDVPFIQEVSDLYTDGIKGAERVDMTDTGHFPPLERPQESTSILRRFLESPLRGT